MITGHLARRPAPRRRTRPTGEPAIEIRGLQQSYGDIEAVRGIDLEVRRGEVLALLGPNGAGKTTTVEILEGYRTPTAGEVARARRRPRAGARSWRERIGIVLQESRPEPNLTVRECLELYAGYYPARGPSTRRSRWSGLTSTARAAASALSGGQRRRLDVALALVGDPDLIFLDEPTTGFDPAARRAAWEVVSGLRALGKTILLTTHYMDEAERLADRIVVIASGGSSPTARRDRSAARPRRGRARDVPPARRLRRPARCRGEARSSDDGAR